MLKTILSASLVGLVALAAGCGGKQVDTSIPVDAARHLNTDLSTTYARTRNLLTDTATEVRNLGALPDGIRAADVDLDLLRHALQACLTEDTRVVPGTNLDDLPREARATLGPEEAPLTNRPAVGRVGACNPSRMLALESYIGVVDDTQREYLVDRVLTVDSARVNLKDVLPAQITDVERAGARARAELLRLRAIATEKRTLAQTTSLSEEDRRRVEVDYDQITAELDQVEDVLAQIDAEVGDWSRLRRQLIDEAAANIAALGTPSR